MYRAIIVDDEADVREGLQLLVNWQERGFRIVGEAANGAEALAYMPIWRPDFVITDIRMPVLDGLEYIRKVRRQFPEIAVVVMSAYGEFHYAQEAIQLGVLDFLLKPLTRQSLAQCMDKAKALLDERDQLRGRERAERQFIQEKWLQELCRGKLVKPDELKLIGDMLHCEDDECFQVLLLEMDDYERYVAECSESELDLKRFMIRNIAAEIGCKRGWLQTYEDSQERIGMLLRHDPRKRPELEALCSEIRDSLRRFVKISVSIGIGKPYRSWQSIRQSRHEALQALEYMLLEGKGGVFHYGQLERYYHSGDRPSAGQAPFNIDTIIRSLDDTDPVRLNRELDLFFEKIRTSAKTPELVRGLCLELIMGMVRLVREYDGDVSRIFGERLQEYETVFVKRSLDALRQRIGELSRRTAQYLSELRAARLPDVMQEVKAFIDEHYSDDISLKMISAHVYKNPAYLGQLFKATFGESFSQYVTRLRIEKAKELLRKDQLRVYEIAEKVGYVTLDTFYQRFKQMTGMNPTEYKHKISS